MAEYTVQLSGDDEQALAYAQEVYARTWSPEVEEGQERVDQDGELALPNDESLIDVADPNQSPQEVAEEEAEEQAGPLAEEVELEE